MTVWRSGTTGTGSTIAIIDTGIDVDNPEFAGRLSPASTDVAGNRSAQQEDDHGTNVALTAAAAKNDTGVVGIAYDSTILALRADAPGTCAAEDPADPSTGCLFNDVDIARGINVAVDAGATVINLSLGGGSINRTLQDAIRRASNAGIVVVVAAGNDGDSSDPEIDPSQPDPFAAGVLGAGGANVIIVGSVDDAGLISGFSNKAGALANAYITARGERICCVYENGELFITEENGTRYVSLFSGTSFSAPQVAGAVALLKQAFPNLTGAQMVDILLDSARDAGAVGTDVLYGRGILDIAAAFAPQGTTTLAGTQQAIAIGDDTLVGSGPMGDALNDVPLEAVLLDSYDRAYGADLGARARGSGIEPRLQQAVDQRGTHLVAGSAKASLAFTVAPGTRAGGLDWAGPLYLPADDADKARLLAARAALKIDPETSFAFGIAHGAGGLAAQLQGRDRPAFMISGSASGDKGFATSADMSFALRHQVGKWGLTASAETGEAWLGARRAASDLQNTDPEHHETRSFSLAADRDFGPLGAIFGVTWLQEDRTVLGGYMHSSLGSGGANSLFVDAELRYDLAPDWSLGGAYRSGVTQVDATGLVQGGSRLTSRAWSLDVTRDGLFGSDDQLGLRVSSPLRVTGGGIAFDLPVDYDYVTRTALYETRTLSLAPRGNELMGEAAWRGPLAGGNASASLFYRRDPGHYADLPDDKGVALKWYKRF